jgi:probable HAF family extracellular repeat protein
VCVTLDFMLVKIPVCLVGLVWTFSLSASTLYTVTTLPLGQFSLPVTGETLSSNGMVAGQSNGQGFFWNGGALSYVPTLGGSESPAFGINSSGVVTGWSFTSSPTEDAYSYSGGTTTSLAPLIGGLGSQGSAINNSGVIVGSIVYAPNNDEAFELSGTTVTYLGFLPGGINSVANAISPSGLITGWADDSFGNEVFIYSTANGLVNIGSLGGPGGAGTAINDAGQVAGYSYVNGGAAQHAFLYSGGTMQDLGTLGGTNSSALGINAAGWVVGSADTSTGTDAFLYMNGVLYDLNSLLVNAPGVDLTSAVAINDNGQILANGPDGAYLLTAMSMGTSTPEPSSLWLAFAALLPVLASVRKRSRREKR